jgi:HKD family nuclease
MVKVMIPVWKDLEAVIQSARGELIICTPFYSEIGLDHVLTNLTSKLTIQIYTRISPSDWANRISDPEALLFFLEDTSAKGHSTVLFVNQRLHAKAYVANKQKALVGSSNLSDGGFEQNIEMMVMLNGKAASDVASLIDSRIKTKAKIISIRKLRNWIIQNKKTVEEVRKSAEGLQAGKLRDAQRNLDKMLGFGRGKSKIRPIMRSEINTFIQWLKRNKKLAGSKMIIARHENIGGQNLQGHVKQCFFGAIRFLVENPALQLPLSLSLKTMRSDDVYQLTDKVSVVWLRHIDRHATDSGDGYDYAILRGILPPSVGGTRLGGGGGISTLKRMLPLVALYLHEN